MISHVSREGNFAEGLNGQIKRECFIASWYLSICFLHFTDESFKRSQIIEKVLA